MEKIYMRRIGKWRDLANLIEFSDTRLIEEYCTVVLKDAHWLPGCSCVFRLSRQAVFVSQGM